MRVAPFYNAHFEVPNLSISTEFLFDKQPRQNKSLWTCPILKLHCISYQLWLLNPAGSDKSSAVPYKIWQKHAEHLDLAVSSTDKWLILQEVFLLLLH